MAIFYAERFGLCVLRMAFCLRFAGGRDTFVRLPVRSRRLFVKKSYSSRELTRFLRFTKCVRATQ